MDDTVETDGPVVKDLDSLAVQFGNSLMESDLKAFHVECSDTDPDKSVDPDGEDSNSMAVDDLSSKEVSTDDLDHDNSKASSFDSDTFATCTVSSSGEKVFRCQDCGLTYNKSSSFSNHRLAHHPSVCGHCGRRFSMPESLESHLQLVCERKGKPEDTLFECHVCKKRVTSKKILQRHLRIHLNSALFPCSVCSKSFGLKTSLEFHMKSHDQQKPFKCKICFITFTEKSTAIRHLKRQHSQNSDFNSFIESNLKPVNPLELASQIQMVPLESEPEVKTEKITGKKHFTPSLKSLLEQPLSKLANYPAEMLPVSDTYTSKVDGMDISTKNEDGMVTGTIVAGVVEQNDTKGIAEPNHSPGSKVYSCKLCDKWYSHSSSLTKHMKKHDASENAMFTCKICNKKCLSKRDLNCHILTHSGVQSFTCPICDSSVARKSSLVRHIRKSHKYTMEEAKEIVQMQMDDAETSELADSHSEMEGTNEDSLMESSTVIQEERLGSVRKQVDVKEEREFQHFTCNICEQIFLEKAKLSEHMVQVHEQETVLTKLKQSNNGIKTEDECGYFVCSLCQQLFTEKKAWQDHMCTLHGYSKGQTEHLLGNEDAPASSKTLATEDNKQAPENINTMDQSLFQTTLSVVLEKDEEGVQKVIKVMPETKTPTPLLFNRTLRKRDVAVKELDENVENLYKPYCCAHCGTRFVEKSSVRRHLKRTHNFTAEEAREYMIRADYTKDSLASKMADIVAEPEPIIAKTVETPEQIWEKSVTEEAEDQEDRNVQRTYLCSVCKKRFMLRSSVRRHLRKIHNFSPEEARECDILAEENTKEIYRIRKPAEAKGTAVGKPALSSLLKDISHGPKGHSTPKIKEEVTCKFCNQKFRQRFALKRHLISTHQLVQKEAEAALEEEINGVKPVSLSCSLCFTEFNNIDKLQTHLMKLHRVSEAVAKRIIAREDMSDYTEGIDQDTQDSAAASDNYDEDESENITENNVKFYEEPDMEESDNVDVDEASEQDENDALFDLKADKDALMVDLNFEAINPWGSDDKADSIESDNLGIIENDSALDFKLTGTEKLMETEESSPLVPMKLDDESINKGKGDENRKSMGSLPFSSYLHHRRTYDCPICGKIMSDASARSKHIRRHEGTAGFKCGFCDRIFTQLRWIESHLKTHCGFGVKCSICHLYCAERHGAKRHLQRMHNMEPNSDEFEQSILNCTLDCKNVQDSASNYTVIDLAKAKDIVEIVPNVLLGRKEDLEKWSKEVANVSNNSIQEESRSKENVKDENSSNLMNNQMESNEDDDAQNDTKDNIRTSIKEGKPAKIDSVISTLHKKLLKKNLNDSNVHEPLDAGSSTETDSNSVYSAENFCPLKIKITKKTKPKSEKPNHVPFDAVENTVEEDYDSDKTIHCDMDSDNQNSQDKEFHQEPLSDTNDKIDDIENLDNEIYKALMPHFDYGETGNSDAVGLQVSALPEPPKKTQTTKIASDKPAHLICWECGKSYSNYKSYREHRRKKHPLSCNKCRQVFVDVLLYQSHMAAHGEGNKVNLGFVIAHTVCNVFSI